MNKRSRIFVIVIASFIAFLGGILFYLYNSSFLIRSNFNTAFNYRVTGDCDAFIDYIVIDQDAWHQRCQDEKDGHLIREIVIQNVSHKFNSDRAFVQAELTRSVDGKDYTYSADYQMRRFFLIWKIDQELK